MRAKNHSINVSGGFESSNESSSLGGQIVWTEFWRVLRIKLSHQEDSLQSMKSFKAKAMSTNLPFPC